MANFENIFYNQSTRKKRKKKEQLMFNFAMCAYCRYIGMKELIFLKIRLILFYFLWLILKIFSVVCRKYLFSEH